MEASPGLELKDPGAFAHLDAISECTSQLGGAVDLSEPFE